MDKLCIWLDIGITVQYTLRGQYTLCAYVCVRCDCVSGRTAYGISKEKEVSDGVVMLMRFDIYEVVSLVAS
jgi:hypothetical protein